MAVRSTPRRAARDGVVPGRRARGYASMVAWMRAFGRVEAAGVEGTGGCGAGLAPRARRRGRPRARGLGARPLERRRRGKSDGIDAEQAARAALAGTRCAPAKSRCAEMGALSALEAAYAGAVKDGGAERLRRRSSRCPRRARARCAARAPRSWCAPAPPCAPGARLLARPWPRSPCARSPGGRAHARRGGEGAAKAEIDALTKALAPSTRSLLGRRTSPRGCCSPQAQHLAPALGGVVLHLPGRAPCPSRAASDRHRLSRAGDRRASLGALHHGDHPHGTTAGPLLRGAQDVEARRRRTPSAASKLPHPRGLPRPRAGYGRIRMS